MTPERIAEIRARLEAATPGPWTIMPYSEADKNIVISEPGVEIDYDDVVHSEQEADAVLIAAAPTDIRDLLAAVEEMRAALQESHRLLRDTPALQGNPVVAKALIANRAALGGQP